MPLFNRQAAVKYALIWALRRNPDYPNFSYNSVTNPSGGGDCTNFISQAMHAGGWEMGCPWTDPRRSERDRKCPESHGRRGGLDIVVEAGSYWPSATRFGWWASPQEGSRLWASAKLFTDWIIEYKKVEACAKADLEVGDLVTAHLFGQNIMHVMMITGERSGIDGIELLYSAHSTDRLNYPLDLAISDNSGQFFMCWKVADSF